MPWVSWPLGASWTPFVTNPAPHDGPADVASGHGTFAHRVLAGDGAGAAVGAPGVAPGASWWSRPSNEPRRVAPGHPELGVPRHALAGRPTDLRELFEQARRRGARIHVAAWGTL